MAQRKKTTLEAKSTKAKVGASVIPDLDTEVDEAMDHIRNMHYLSTEVSRRESINFLHELIERCATLAGEITQEIMKYGEEH
jgi:hypothetical protein